VLLPTRPEIEIPEIPRDLSEVSDKVLMTLFTDYVGWNNYLDVVRVDAEIEEANAETAVKVEEATAMVGAGWGPKDKVTLARAERDVDPEVIAVRRRYEEARARRKMLTVLCGNLERGAALLSRELTRRVSRAPVEGRHAGWGT
jgi:hypothetical protein